MAIADDTTAQADRGNTPTLGTAIGKDPVLRALLICAAASVAFWAYPVLFGLNYRPDTVPPDKPFGTYYQAMNWFPFPAFYLILLPPLWLSWQSMGAAWTDLVRTGVLTTRTGDRPSDVQTELLLAAIRQKRRWALGAALIATAAVNIADVWPSLTYFLGDASGTEQMKYACTQSNVWTMWIWETLATTVPDPCAKNLPPMARVEPGLVNLFFWLFTFAQQAVLVFFVSLVIAQLLLHTLLFGWFDRFLPAPAGEMNLRLSVTSPVNEFGLERWNYVLNNFYWMSCPVLLMVFLSRNATESNLYQPGQHMLGIVVPAVLLLPMVITILARQARLPDVWATLTPDQSDAYSRQQLWPLDRNWSSKLGIILAFTLAALSLGYEISALLGVTG